MRTLLSSVVGEDPAELLRHRTEPLRVVLRPAEILADAGCHAVYDESQRILTEQRNRCVWRYELAEDVSWRALDEGAPECDARLDEWTRPGSVLAVPRSEEAEQECDRLLGLEARVEDLRCEDDPRWHGQALRATVIAKAAELFPGVSWRSRSTWTAADSASSTSSTARGTAGRGRAAGHKVALERHGTEGLCDRRDR